MFTLQTPKKLDFKEAKKFIPYTFYKRYAYYPELSDSFSVPFGRLMWVREFMIVYTTVVNGASKYVDDVRLSLIKTSSDKKYTTDLQPSENINTFGNEIWAQAALNPVDDHNLNVSFGTSAPRTVYKWNIPLEINDSIYFRLNHVGYAPSYVDVLAKCYVLREGL